MRSDPHGQQREVGLRRPFSPGDAWRRTGEPGVWDTVSCSTLTSKRAAQLRQRVFAYARRALGTRLGEFRSSMQMPAPRLLQPACGGLLRRRIAYTPRPIRHILAAACACSMVRHDHIMRHLPGLCNKGTPISWMSGYHGGKYALLAARLGAPLPIAGSSWEGGREETDGLHGLENVSTGGATCCCAATASVSICQVCLNAVT